MTFKQKLARRARKQNAYRRTMRSATEIQQDFNMTAAQLGFKEYQIDQLQDEVNGLKDRMAALNLEFKKLAEEEKAKAKVEAAIPSPAEAEAKAPEST